MADNRSLASVESLLAANEGVKMAREEFLDVLQSEMKKVGNISDLLMASHHHLINTP